MADKTYVVTGLMAIVNLDNGSAVHLQRDAVVPSNATKDHVEHLLAVDLIAEGPVVGGIGPVFVDELAVKPGPARKSG